MTSWARSVPHEKRTSRTAARKQIEIEDKAALWLKGPGIV
jgi:hypothetical protein